MHKILQNFHASVSGRFGRLGSSHFLSENFMTSVIKLGLKMVIVPNVNRPTVYVAKPYLGVVKINPRLADLAPM
jgi:hypothetical protein